MYIGLICLVSFVAIDVCRSLFDLNKSLSIYIGLFCKSVLMYVGCICLVSYVAIDEYLGLFSLYKFLSIYVRLFRFIRVSFVSLF